MVLWICDLFMALKKPGSTGGGGGGVLIVQNFDVLCVGRAMQVFLGDGILWHIEEAF